jgi:hypothetical protein
MKKVSIIAVCIALMCIMGCASGGMINTIPSDVKVFDGDNMLGRTPYFYWDREPSEYTKELTLKKEGYADNKIKITKNVFYVHRLFAPPLLALPWVLGYKPEYLFELERTKGHAANKIMQRVPVIYRLRNTMIEQSNDKVASIKKAVFVIKNENGHGNGFLINSEGYAVTSYHVIQGNNSLEAIFYDGQIIKANIVKIIPDVDLALIKLTGSEFSYLPLAKLNDVSVGKEIYAVGNSMSLPLLLSFTKGIISGVRKTESVSLLLTNVALNPNNSGGPLVDMNGVALGVVSFGLKKPDIEELGFAISSDDIVKYLELTEMPGLSASGDQKYEKIRGIMLKNGDIIRGEILNINVNTVQIRTKDGRVLSYSFVEEVQSLITE